MRTLSRINDSKALIAPTRKEVIFFSPLTLSEPHKYAGQKKSPDEPQGRLERTIEQDPGLLADVFRSLACVLALHTHCLAFVCLSPFPQATDYD